MGLQGAAMAALLSRAAIFGGTLYFMRTRLDMLSFNKPDPGELRSSWADVLHVGIPAAGTNAIIPIATGVITAMLARYGPEAVAGFGVASRVESLTLVLFYALSAVIGPFVGQNISAGKSDRIFEALRLCLFFCLGTGLAIAGILALSAGFIPTLFSDNPQVTDVSTLFLTIAPISYGAYGIVMVMNASFNGMGKPMPAVHISVARMAVIYLPLAFIGERFFGITGIFVAYTIANIFTGLIGYTWACASVQEQCDAHAEPLIVTETV
jgi:Na+-driven multidrug efflux pump